MAEYIFRPIQFSDIQQVANLIRVVMTEFGCVGEGYSINDPEIDDMFHAYDREGAAFFVIENNGRILGCGGIAPLEGGDGKTCELRKMYYYPELRGKGWGKKMLTYCLETAKKKGYTKCYLETVERMEQANLLYQKMGFEKSCERFGETGHGSCESFYIKELK
ncbi:MAG: GNAT family N-acetyltransferase [Saprospiraceae bacterium]